MQTGNRWLVSVAAFAAALVPVVALAPSASAVDATFGCRTAGTNTTFFSATYGQTYTFTIETDRPAGTSEGCRQKFLYNEDQLTYTATEDGQPFSLQYGVPVALNPGSTYEVSVTVPSSGTGNLLSLSLNNDTGPLHGDVIRILLPGTDLGGSGPPNVLQQTGVPSSGQCADVDDSDARFLGYAGGWSKTWAAWINQDTGGEVCTRTLTYQAGPGVWRIE